MTENKTLILFLNLVKFSKTFNLLLVLEDEELLSLNLSTLLY